MATLKKLITANRTFKSTFTVISFDKKTGKRDLMYGGLDILSAFGEVTYRLANDFDVVITDENGWKEITKKEFKKGNSRINYDEAKQYNINFKKIISKL